MDVFQDFCSYCCRKVSDLRRCTRCLSVCYCSKACQTMAWPSHKFTCVRQSDIEKKTAKKIKSTGNETLLETTSKKRGITNSSEASATDGDPETANCKSSPDDFRRRSDVDTNSIGDKMKNEYCNFEANVKDESRGYETEPKASGESAYAKEEVIKDETDFGNSEKDRNPSKRNSDGEEEKRSGSVTNVCRCCSSPGCSQKCSRCKEAFYCSTECQRKDWSTHKASCRKKLTEEEEKIKALHEKMTRENEHHKRVMEGTDSGDAHAFTWTIQTFQGPFERFFQMLTLEQALFMAPRPAGSLERATRLARIFFPLHNIVTEFDDIPPELMFPFFPFMFPPRGGYVLVAFMYRYHEHVMRHGVYLKDAKDKESKVEFYLDHVGDNPFPFFSYSQVKPGGYICLVDPVMHLFGDGSVGIRINNPDEVMVLNIEMIMK